MKKSRFDGLPGVMRGQTDTPALQAKQPMSPEDDDEPETDAEDGEDDEEDPDMTDKTKKGAEAAADAPKTDLQPEAAAPSPAPQASDEAAAMVRAEERQRMKAVFASEHVKGREGAAVALLSDSDMSADKIVAMLPSLTPSASSDDGDKMLAQMREGADPDLGNEGEPENAAAANHGWAKAHAKVAQMHGRKAK